MGTGNMSVTQNGDFSIVDFDNPSDAISQISESKTLFDMGLKLGYQHYFGESQNHGIRTSLGIGSAIPPIDLKTSKTASRKDPSNNGSTQEFLIGSTYKAFSLKTSIEVDYLWDFFNRGDHTVGLDVGVGYEMGVWFGKSTGSFAMKGDSSLKADPKKDATLLTHTIYPKIGIHYYYGNHQFNLAYKFGGVFSGIKTESKGSFDDLTLKGTLLKLPLTQSIQSSPSYISFGYSYRF